MELHIDTADREMKALADKLRSEYCENVRGSRIKMKEKENYIYKKRKLQRRAELMINKFM